VQSFAVNSYDPLTAQEFMAYLSKNTLNLVLPGTPFPESYAPSSQLFEQVIEKNLVGGEVDAESLIKALNTQPYTVFGIFIILFGPTSPVFLFVFTFGYIFIYNKFNDVFVKILMLYFFWGVMTSFGFETVIGNSVRMYLSIFFMYFLINIFSYLGIGMLRSKRLRSNQRISMVAP
jgi:hypothetical protein